MNKVDPPDDFDDLDRRIARALREAPIPPVPDLDLKKLQESVDIRTRGRRRVVRAGLAAAAGVALVSLSAIQFQKMGERDQAPVAESAGPPPADDYRGTPMQGFDWSIHRAVEADKTSERVQGFLKEAPAHSCVYKSAILLHTASGAPYQSPIGISLSDTQSDADGFAFLNRRQDNGYDIWIVAPCAATRDFKMRVTLLNNASGMIKPPIAEQTTIGAAPLRLILP